MMLSPRAAARPAHRNAILAILPLLAGLASCTAHITGGEKLTSADPDSWQARRPALPVEIHGALPGRPNGELAALFTSPARQTQYAANGGLQVEPPTQRIVIYVNAGDAPPNSLICAHGYDFVTVPQSGSRAKVAAALCDGTTAVSVAQADVRSDQSPAAFKAGLEVVQDQLFQSLYPYHVLTAGLPDPV